MINRPQNVERKKGENLYLEYKVEQLTKKKTNQDHKWYAVAEKYYMRKNWD